MKIRNKNGFTLLEFILYIGITAVILWSVSVFLFLVLQSQIKNQTIAEVEQQGIQVLQIITQTIRNAEAINSPAPGTNESALSLDIIDIANDPTVFDLSDGVIRVKEGMNNLILLTNSLVAVSDLAFQNLSGTIRIQFTLSLIDSKGRNEFSYSKTFYGSASIR